MNTFYLLGHGKLVTFKVLNANEVRVQTKKAGRLVQLGIYTPDEARQRWRDLLAKGYKLSK